MRIGIPKQEPGEEAALRTAPYWNIDSGLSVAEVMKKGLQTGSLVTFKCPNGHVGHLRLHQINASGEVEPSVVCPRPWCKFHEHIKLEGWEEELKADE